MQRIAQLFSAPWRLLGLLLLVFIALGVLVSLRAPRPAPFIGMAWNRAGYRHPPPIQT
jgi:hypothetical protein